MFALRFGLALALVALSTLSCDGETTKGVTAAVVKKGVEVSKAAVKGVADGVEEGRKSGDSLDEAQVITSWKELEAVGSVALISSESAEGMTQIELSLENRTKRPLRLSDIEVLGLDQKGFSMKPVSGVKPSVTIPPDAKEKLSVSLRGEGLAEIRIWDHEIPR